VLVELRDQAELREVVEGSDIRAILAGHVHFSTSGTFAGVPVSVASATCYTQDLTTEARGTRPQDGAQSYNLVHVYDEMVLNSVVPITAGRTLSTTSAADSAAVLAAHGVTVPERRNEPLLARRPDRVDRELEAMTSPITLPRRSE
jgi:3',5'-cyclic AMP phosphodiesterase CpdA